MDLCALTILRSRVQIQSTPSMFVSMYSKSLGYICYCVEKKDEDKENEAGFRPYQQLIEQGCFENKLESI